MSKIEIKIIPQTEEIKSEPTELTKDEWDKLQYDLLGERWRIDRESKWNLTKFDNVDITENDKFQFKLQIKSDFPPPKH